MRTFEMHRGNDESGVSGTGKVLEGVVFSDGPCVVRWVTELNGRSEARYDSFASFVDIHINSHKSNKTTVIFSDGEVYAQEPKAVIPRTKKRRKADIPKVAVQPVQTEVGQSDNEPKPIEVPHSESKKAVDSKASNTFTNGKNAAA